MVEDRDARDAIPAPRLADTVRGFLDDVPESAAGALDDARDLYRRAAMAVTRTAGDNGALVLLAGAAALAGLSWLWLRARKRAR